MKQNTFLDGMKAALELVNNPDDHRRLSLYIETLEENQALYLGRCKPGVSGKIAEEFAEKLLTGMSDLATIAHQDDERLKQNENNTMTYNEWFVFYTDGSSEKTVYPADWTKEDIQKATGSDDVMGPYPAD